MIALILALAQAYCAMFGYKGFIQSGDALFCAVMLEFILEFALFIMLFERVAGR